MSDPINPKENPMIDQIDCDGEWREAGRRQDGDREVVRFRCTGCADERFFEVRGTLLRPLTMGRPS